LTGAMLHLTLDTSPGVATEVDKYLAEVSAASTSAGDAVLTEGLLAHAKMLRELLPATDGLLKALFALPSEAEQTRIRDAVLQQQRIAALHTSRARYAWIITSLLSLALLAQQGMRLRSRALDLQRRAAMEHLIAALSTRFINSRPHEIESFIEQALAQLAQF